MPRSPRPDELDDAGNVVDSAVLAERRARRDEQARAARRDATVLEARLREAESELDGAERERERLLDALGRRDEALLRAAQGEHAEQRRRVEIEDDAAERHRVLELRVEELKARLAAAELRISELAGELERGERAAGRAREALADRDRVDAELAGLRTRLDAAEDRIAVERGRVARAVAEERERAEALVEAERARAEVARTAAGEAHAARRAAEAELERLLEGGGDELATELVERLRGDLEVARDALAERLVAEAALSERVARLTEMAAVVREHFLGEGAATAQPALVTPDALGSPDAHTGLAGAAGGVVADLSQLPGDGPVWAGGGHRDLGLHVTGGSPDAALIDGLDAASLRLRAERPAAEAAAAGADTHGDLAPVAASTASERLAQWAVGQSPGEFAAPAAADEAQPDRGAPQSESGYVAADPGPGDAILTLRSEASRDPVQAIMSLRSGDNSAAPAAAPADERARAGRGSARRLRLPRLSLRSLRRRDDYA